MSILAAKIREDLRRSADPNAKESMQRFFKEPLNCYGMKTADMAKIMKAHLGESLALGKAGVFALCEELFASGIYEEGIIAASWADKVAGGFLPGDAATFRGWVERYINNWAECDTFCNHAVGDLLQMYPQVASEVKCWSASGNRWLRRASAVSFIVPAKRGEFLTEAFEISDALLADRDDMVQKGYGWLLKEESRTRRGEVFDFVMARRAAMPRTALRYAIELMPKEMRAEAMKRP
jgi:3-methyladenine DNA glycosylase AlkD